MAHEKNHDYHILNPSIWPLIGAGAAFIMLFGAVLWFHGSGPWMFLIGFVGVLYVMFAWWTEVVQESRAGDTFVLHQVGVVGGLHDSISHAVFDLIYLLRRQLGRELGDKTLVQLLDA